MKTLTEFAALTLKLANATKNELVAAGKSAEELATAMGEALKLEGDKLTRLLEAIEHLENKFEDLKRVIVLELAEGEKSPAHAKLRGALWYLAEYFAPIGKKPGKEGRFSRDGKGGDRKRGDKKGRGKRGNDRDRRPKSNEMTADGASNSGGDETTRAPRPPRGPRPPRAPRPPRPEVQLLPPDPSRSPIKPKTTQTAAAETPASNSGETATTS